MKLLLQSYWNSDLGSYITIVLRYRNVKFSVRSERFLIQTRTKILQFLEVNKILFESGSSNLLSRGDGKLSKQVTIVILKLHYVSKH